MSSEGLKSRLRKNLSTQSDALSHLPAISLWKKCFTNVRKIKTTKVGIIVINISMIARFELVISPFMDNPNKEINSSITRGQIVWFNDGMFLWILGPEFDPSPTGCSHWTNVNLRMIIWQGFYRTMQSVSPTLRRPMCIMDSENLNYFMVVWFGARANFHYCPNLKNGTGLKSNSKTIMSLRSFVTNVALSESITVETFIIITSPTVCTWNASITAGLRPWSMTWLGRKCIWTSGWATSVPVRANPPDSRWVEAEGPVCKRFQFEKIKQPYIARL